MKAYNTQYDLIGNTPIVNIPALSAPKGSNIFTFVCDLGERSYSKLYNKNFLAQRAIKLERQISDYVLRLIIRVINI